MRHPLTVVLLGLLAQPLAAQTGLTIYNDGRVLVRRTLPTPVPAGASTHQLALGVLDPSSVFALDSGIVITGTSFDAAVDEANTLRRAVGKTLWFRTGRYTNNLPDTVPATLIGVDPERYRLADGKIVFQRPGQAIYPPELVLTAPTLAIALRAQTARRDLRLGWFTGGATWIASYDVVLGRGSARVTGSAVIPSQTLLVADAELQLLAGSVGRAAQPMLRREARDAVVGFALAEAPASEEQVGEARLYTVPGRHTLEPGITTTASLFDPATAPWDRSYVVRGQLPWYGPMMQQGEESPAPVEVHYTLTRRAGTPFGDLPLPGGVARIYEPDQAGRLQLVGEAGLRHTAPGQELRLPAGHAFDLTARRVQTTYRTQRDSLRTHAFADFRVTVANAKDSAAVVDVLEERQGEWSVLQSSVRAERLSSTRTRFRVRVPGKAEVVLTYRIRAVW